MAKFWHSTVPKRCELCSGKFKTFFADGKTVFGSRAIMCLKCLDDCGVGLGAGKGQLYTKVKAKDGHSRPRWMKVAG